MDLRSLGTAHLGLPNPGSMSLGSAGIGAAQMARDAGPDLHSFEEIMRATAAARTPASASAEASSAEVPPAPGEGAVSAGAMRGLSPAARGGSPFASAPGVTIDRDSELFQQAQELESFLVKTLVNGMRSTVQRSDLIEQGFAGRMYEDMLFDEHARNLSRNAGFGLAELAYLELTGQRGRVVVR